MTFFLGTPLGQFIIGGISASSTAKSNESRGPKTKSAHGKDGSASEGKN